MEVRLYQNYSAPNVLDKDIRLIQTMTGTIKEGTSIKDPSILIAGSLPILANYAYIPEFNRYYHIIDVMAERGNLFRVTMHVDVLESFKGYIKSAEVIAERSTSDYNLMLRDMAAIQQANCSYKVQRFGSFAFDKSAGKYILGVV